MAIRKEIKIYMQIGKISRFNRPVRPYFFNKRYADSSVRLYFFNKRYADSPVRLYFFNKIFTDRAMI